MVEQSQRIPEGLNFFETIQALGANIGTLLGRATLVSYNLDTSMQQFQALYASTAPMTSTADVFTLRERLLAAQTEASGVTVSVTAVRQGLTDLYTRMCNLLNGSWTAHGALDSAQIAAQQTGFVQSTLASLTAIQATHARNTAQQQAQQAALERLQLQAIEGAMRDTTPETYTPQGQLPRKGW